MNKETTNEDFIICPACGYENEDSFEVESGDWDCHQCNAKLEIDKDVSVTYSAYLRK